MEFISPLGKSEFLTFACVRIGSQRFGKGAFSRLILEPHDRFESAAFLMQNFNSITAYEPLWWLSY